MSDDAKAQARSTLGNWARSKTRAEIDEMASRIAGKGADLFDTLKSLQRKRTS